jgi:hypothetical protein
VSDFNMDARRRLQQLNPDLFKDDPEVREKRRLENYCTRLQNENDFLRARLSEINFCAKGFAPVDVDGKPLRLSIDRHSEGMKRITQWSQQALDRERVEP